MTSETQMRYGSRVRRQGRSRRWQSNQESRSRRREASDGVTVTNYTLYRPNWQGAGRGPWRDPGTGASTHSCMANFTFLQSGKCPWRFRQGHQRGEIPFSWWAGCGCTPVVGGDFGWVRLELRPLTISIVGRTVFGWWNLPLVVSLCCPE